MEGTNNLLTVEQVAEILQLNILTVYKFVRQGKLDAVCLGRNYRIMPDDLAVFIESSRVKVVKSAEPGD